MRATHWELRYETDYIAKLSQFQDGTCMEVVFYRGQSIHQATFPASLLKTADRGVYLKAMVASVAAENRRKATEESEVE